MNPFAHFQALYGHLELSEDDAALNVFLSGWNTAMHEMMERVNKMPFQNDTRASFALYFQSQMVNLEAIERSVREPVAVYGYCPECGAKGVMRERRPNGNDKCANGHTYPSAQRKESK